MTYIFLQCKINCDVKRKISIRNLVELCHSSVFNSSQNLKLLQCVHAQTIPLNHNTNCFRLDTLKINLSTKVTAIKWEWLTPTNNNQQFRELITFNDLLKLASCIDKENNCPFVDWCNQQLFLNYSAYISIVESCSLYTKICGL